jgi:hypothetical protein
MGNIFTLEADDPQTDTIISKLQKSQVKNTRVLSQTKKTIHSTSKQNKTNQTRPTTTKKENPRKKKPPTSASHS